MTSQKLELETLLQLYALLGAIADPVRKLSSVYTKLQSGAAAADRIYSIMDREAQVKSNPSGPWIKPVVRTIEFRDVCFSYLPGVSVLSSINLKINAGETIAFVGKNGCGKTTLLNLLPRFFDPDHGSIFVDGIDIRQANLRSLRRQIGLVPQDTTLFETTIFNNIAYGDRSATLEDVQDAAKRAHIHEAIMALEHGYETLLMVSGCENGYGLSGGQKQRIALARAILRNPSILILDEFSSQIDSEDEVLIQQAMTEFIRGRTTFMISHRLNTLEMADRIVVMDQGRIEAVGTHVELLASCNIYQRLHEAHFQRKVA
jgi:ABC-type multidrug transport system fused ATPase/permease subunit